MHHTRNEKIMNQMLSFIVIVAMICMACGMPKSIDYEQNMSRFETVYSQKDAVSWYEVSIIRDTETGYKYLYVSGGCGSGLCRFEEPMIQTMFGD